MQRDPREVCKHGYDVTPTTEMVGEIFKVTWPVCPLCIRALYAAMLWTAIVKRVEDSNAAD